MKITVVTAEYNPLHNGHLYHIEKTKEAFPDDFILVVMSGSFVMRGEPAVFDKYTRAKHAIQAGADAVVELPAFSSFLSGEKFGESAVNIAKAVKADRISFGSEQGEINNLVTINSIMENPPENFSNTFKSKMKEGMSFPRATWETFQDIYPDKPYADILTKPNNTLALFYLKAIGKSGISPFTVKRSDAGYDSNDACGKFLSASGIRQLLKEGKIQETKAFLPDFVYEDLVNQNLVKYEDFSTLCLFKLRTMGIDKIRDLYDLSEGLENRFVKYASEARDLSDLLEKVKTKRYTLSRLRRIALYALFDVTKQKVENFLASPQYGRILAVRADKKELLPRLKEAGLVTCYKDVSEDVEWLWEEENRYADTHALLLNKKISNKNTLFI